MKHERIIGRQQVREQEREVRRLFLPHGMVGQIALAVNDAGPGQAFLGAGTTPWLSPHRAAEVVDRAERLLWENGYRIDIYWPVFAADTRWRTAVLAELPGCLAVITPDPYARLMPDHGWYPVHWNHRVAGAA